jgi:flagellar basal-body rod modification protein FlgD
MNMNPVTPNAAAGNAAPTTATPTSAAADAESTFLNLLVTELKSQDPTSPMDPTQMVGQMLSMNQLNQLIDINQILQAAFPPATSSGSATQPVVGGN